MFKHANLGRCRPRGKSRYLIDLYAEGTDSRSQPKIMPLIIDNCSWDPEHGAMPKLPELIPTNRPSS